MILRCPACWLPRRLKKEREGVHIMTAASNYDGNDQGCRQQADEPSPKLCNHWCKPHPVSVDGLCPEAALDRGVARVKSFPGEVARTCRGDGNLASESGSQSGTGEVRGWRLRGHKAGARGRAEGGTSRVSPLPKTTSTFE